LLCRCVAWALFVVAHAAAAATIDRQAVVRRNSPAVESIDATAPFSVGNGRFAFTVDVTGLQSLGSVYHPPGIPLDTMARWAWYSEPNPHLYTLAEASTVIDTDGKPVSYPTQENSAAGQWLRRNPSNYPLGEVGFVDGDGQPLAASDLTAIHQELDLWTGIISSRFAWRGIPVEVATLVHPDHDTLVVTASSRALRDGGLRVRLRFPRGFDAKTKNIPGLDWTLPGSHSTELAEHSSHSARLIRRRDALELQVGVNWEGSASFRAASSPHSFELLAKDRDTLAFEISFGLDRLPPVSSETEAREICAKHWAAFWASGAAVDLAGSTDPRARELERRVVLSQYLTAIQFDGEVPPSETGLTASSWYGKHNTEMVWWHVAHFAQWGRPEYIAHALDWFKRTLPYAQSLAAQRGLAGARWSKMVGPDGRESPGGNPLIVWNEPHSIYLAELLYRAHPTEDTLHAWKDVVLETASCMATMLHKDEKRGLYVLGPPLWIAQEIYDRTRSQNPCYELGYWRFALETAQAWRTRLGMRRSADWDQKIEQLSPLPVRGGRYVALESIPDTWENKESRHDHPSFLMALGMLPGPEVDRATMGRTLDSVLSSWDWDTKIWGWDYPMIAMTAARLGEPEKAMDILMKDGPGNHYSVNGQCPQRIDLSLYLPANGALLAAVGLMAGGWEGAPPGEAPGFPRDGAWHVRAEGFSRLP